MKRLLPVALVMLVFLVAAPRAHALGVYVGASGGNAGFEIDESNIDFDESATAWKAFGGITLGRLFAVEASYNDFGEPEDDDISIDSSAYGIFGRIGLPIWRFDIFAKAGYYKWDVDADVMGSSAGDDGSDLAYGAGAAFRIFGGFAIRAEYEVYEIDTDVDSNLEMISLGLEWRFLGD